MNSMRRMIMGLCAALCVTLAAGSAFAGYGAFAIESSSGKVGLTWDKATKREADDQAIKDCGGSGCKIAFRTGPHQCAAIAKPEKGIIVGAAYRATRDAAVLAAVNDCQKQTHDQCKVKVSQCNR
jgi:hypothetical protein